MPVLAIPVLAVVGALLALLILYGAKSLGNFVAHILPTNIPIIGGAVRRFVVDAVDGAIAVIQVTLENAAAPIAKVISYPVTAVRNMLTNLADAMSEISVALITIKRTFVPHLIAVAVAQLRQVIDSVQSYLYNLLEHNVAALLSDIAAARSYALHLANAVESYVLGQLAAVKTQLVADIYAARDYALHLAETVQSTVLARLAAVEQSLLAQIAALSTWATARFAQVEALTVAKFAQAEADIVTAERAAIATSVATVDHAVAAGLSDIWDGVAAGVAAAEGVIATDFPDILAGLRAIPESLPLDVAGEAVLAGGAAIALTRYLERCGIPNCRNLSQYGRDLQALLGLVGDASLLALVVELATQPEQAAREVQSLFGGTADAVTRQVRDLIGAA